MKFGLHIGQQNLDVDELRRPALSHAPRLPPKRDVETRERLVERGRLVRAHARLHVLLLERQPRPARLVQHPGKRNVGQASVVVPAAHVRVRAGKPDLFERLAAFRMFLLVPGGCAKVTALFVGGQRLVGVCNS